jgi:hypothetical protein
MTGDTMASPDTISKDRLRAGRVTSRARSNRSLTKTPSLPGDTADISPKQRPVSPPMSFAPPAPSSWPPPRTSKGRTKIERHANALRLNGKSNPQEPA